jgi:NAD(P)-dependent dehydrogenase (short-subunit alcohol dehydrogenase family)
MDTNSWFDFSEQVVLVSGGAGGIGREITLAFARAGAHVVVADLDLDAASLVATEAGSGAASTALDVCDAIAVEALAEQLWEQHGHVDVLVNTAAVYVRIATVDLSEADFDRTMNINVKGTWLLSQAVGVA